MAGWATRVLKLRGHEPVIHERAMSLAVHSFRQARNLTKMAEDLLAWYRRQMEVQNIEVHLGRSGQSGHSSVWR